MKILGAIFLIVFISLCLIFLVINIFFISTEAIGHFLFNLLGVEYSSFFIWPLLIFGTLAITYYLASLTSYKDLYNKDKIMSLLEPTDDNLPTKKEINLSEVNLQSLIGELQNTLTSPTPIFFKGWGNRRLELDVERVRLLNQYIRSIADTGQSFIRLKVDALISYDKINHLAHTELNELKRQSIISDNNLKLLQDKYENELTALKTDTELMKIRLEKERIELQRQQDELQRDKDRHQMEMAERETAKEERIMDATNRKNINETHIYLEKWQAKFDGKVKKQVIELYKKIVQDLDTENITPSQTLILISLFGSGVTSSIEDFDMKRKLAEETLNKMKQETAYKKAEAKSKFTEAEVLNFKYERDKAATRE